jgi:hypothetical protein
LPSAPDAATRVRAAVRETLGGTVPSRTIDDVLIVATELLSSRARAAGLTAGEWIEFRLRVGEQIRVELKQSRPPVPAVNGDSLELVSRLSTRWGLVEDTSWLAWAEISVPIQ